jgi:hypothetical protein
MAFKSRRGSRPQVPYVRYQGLNGPGSDGEGPSLICPGHLEQFRFLAVLLVQSGGHVDAEQPPKARRAGDCSDPTSP